MREFWEMLTTITKLTQPDFYNAAKRTKSNQLLTISLSHYCEFSRWVLQYKGKSFTEHGYAPVEHVLPTLSVRICGKKKHFSSSSRMVPIKADGTCMTFDEKKYKEKGAASVPVLVTPEGDVCKDSWEIANYAGFDPIEPALRDVLDQEIGVYARQLAYFYILKPSNSDLANRLFTFSMGWFWTVLFYLGLGYFLKLSLRKSLRLDQPDSLRICREKLTASFSKIETELRKSNSPFLGGNKPGAADFALASLAGPVCSAPEYALGKYLNLFDELEKRDSAFRAEIEHWRTTYVGMHVLKMYRGYRATTESA